ncbi:hypothetical protein [Clostridium cuniculi]|uniref:hypothetical protein n=1 Tax=Clostridium cuniculi TaxID=2548455 RepID=UPI0010566E9D|nr:hypothetical protein [Clostridium cuniculi]
MNYKLKTYFSDSQYLNYENDIACFKNSTSSNNEVWKFENINPDEGLFMISNLSNNKYLFFDKSSNIVKISNLDKSKIENFYWKPLGIGVDEYLIQHGKFKDFYLYVYDTNGSILNQPLMVSNSIIEFTKNFTFNLEKVN